MIDPQWFESESRRIFAKRKWWRDPETVLLVSCAFGIVLALVFAWARADWKSDPVQEQCIVHYVQHRVIAESRGVIVRDVAGRKICEVRRG